MSHISEATFINRFIAIILRGQVFPKKILDRHILYISATLRLEPDHPYAESELNDILRSWSTLFGDDIGLDHVTLRRYLVDEGYLQRDSGGESYQLTTSGLPYSYDTSISALDLEDLIHDARTERERKKQEYLRSAGK
jgi:hypothetical protein